jgi:hypothetical protein
MIFLRISYFKKSKQIFSFLRFFIETKSQKNFYRLVGGYVLLILPSSEPVDNNPPTYFNILFKNVLFLRENTKSKDI